MKHIHRKNALCVRKEIKHEAEIIVVAVVLGIIEMELVLLIYLKKYRGEGHVVGAMVSPISMRYSSHMRCSLQQ